MRVKTAPVNSPLKPVKIPAPIVTGSTIAIQSSSSSSSKPASSAAQNNYQSLVPEESSSNTATCPLFELCDSAYVLKSRKGKKRRIVTQSASRTNNRDISILNSPISSANNANTLPTSPTPGGGLQVEFVDGKIVLRESGAAVSGAINEGEYFEEIEESVNACATYASFSRRQPSAVWGIEETRLFYMALRQCGIEFSLLQQFFPKRTRKQLKLKYYREEKSHPELIKRALSTNLPLDMSVFEAQLGLFENLVKTEEECSSLSNSNLVFLHRLHADPSVFDRLLEDDESVVIC